MLPFDGSSQVFSLPIFLNFMEIKNTSDPAVFSKVYADLTTKIYGAAKNFPSVLPFPGRGFSVFENEILACCWVSDNPDLIFENEKAACFGWFEGFENEKAVEKMMAAATDFAKNLGKKYLLGPMNGSTWDNYRLAVSNPDFTYLLDLQHPQFYIKILESTGFYGIRDYATNLDTTFEFDEKRAARKFLDFSKNQKIRFRNINLEKYEDELVKIHTFCLANFRQNFLFTPIGFENFREKYLPLKNYLDPRFIILAEAENGEICGLMFAVPNLADRQKRGLVIKTIARKLENRYAGLGLVLGKILYERARDDGFDYILHAFMEQSNVSNNVSATFSGREVKRYRLFGKEI